MFTILGKCIKESTYFSNGVIPFPYDIIYILGWNLGVKNAFLLLLFILLKGSFQY